MMKIEKALMYRCDICERSIDSDDDALLEWASKTLSDKDVHVCIVCLKELETRLGQCSMSLPNPPIALDKDIGEAIASIFIEMCIKHFETRYRCR